MEKIYKYSEYKLNEEGDGGGAAGSGDSGGGTAFVTNNIGGMGNIVSPQTGTISGSLWQAGSGTIGSGDRAAYDMGKKFGFVKKKKKKKKSSKPKISNWSTIPKTKKTKKKKTKKKKTSKSIKKFSDWLTGPKN